MHVPEQDTRVVELRVHGVLGATGPKLTDSVESVDVAGDGVGRVVRPADRLRRPVPGPTLRSGNRTVSRIVEGYVWGGMTSGGLGKATWAMLFPFALANVAHWMLPPVRPESRASAVLGRAARALLRLAAMLLTMLFVAQLTVVTLDVFAAQCLRPGSGCVSFVPDFVRDLDALRVWIGLLPVALITLLMYRLSSVSWQVTAGSSASSRQGAPRPSARAPMLPGANVVSDPDTPALRALHTTAALSTVTLLFQGGPFMVSTDPRWIVALALVGVSLIGCVLLDDPEGMWATAPRTHRNSLLWRTARRVLITTAALTLGSAAFAPGQLRGPLPGSGPAVDALTVALGISCLALAVLLVPAARLAKPMWARLPRQLRPWAGGWLAAPIVFLAAMLGTGFGAGLALTARQALGVEQLRLPTAYQDVTTFWGTTAVFAALIALVTIPGMLLWRWRKAWSGDSVPSEVGLLHAGRYKDRHAAASAWLWSRMQQRYTHFALLLIAGVLLASTGLTAVSRLAGFPRAVWADWLSGLGVVALAGLAIGLLRMVFLAAKERHAARYLGVLCDLTLFWPREAHPVVPPCYALKVIPELVARAQEHLSDPNTRVVLVGHSQGSLLVTVAAARLLESLPEADRHRVGLVTAGSQLQWAYSRAFPAVVSHDALRDLSGMLGGRWRALCRGTDAMGGAVTTWSRHVYDGSLLGVGFQADGRSGPLPPATRGPTGALVLGGDHWLPDPQRGPVSCRRWVPGVMRHTDYAGDPEWDRAVAMAAGLELPEQDTVLGLTEHVTASTGPRAGEAARVPTRRDRRAPPHTAETRRTDESDTEGNAEARRAPVGNGAGGDDTPRETEAIGLEPVTAEPARAGTGGAVDAIPRGRLSQVTESATSAGGAETAMHETAVREVVRDEEAARSDAAKPAPSSDRTGSNDPAPLPEITEPAGRAAPWERAQGLHPPE